MTLLSSVVCATDLYDAPLMPQITSVAMAVPTYYVMKRRVPPYPLVSVSWLPSVWVCFSDRSLGSAWAAVGAAMEVRRKMHDPGSTSAAQHWPHTA